MSSVLRRTLPSALAFGIVSCIRFRQRINVDLPQPDGPMIAETTAFMYLGKLIEVGRTRELFERPREALTESYITGRFG